MIKIVLVDDHRLIAEGVKLMLSDQEDMEILGYASCSEELFALLEDVEANLVLLDINMPGEDGIKTARKLSRCYPEIGIIALSMHQELSLIRAMVQAGARAYLFKDSGKEEVVRAIYSVMRGGSWFPEGVRQKLEEQENKVKSHAKLFPSLSRREKEVLRLIVEEYTTGEIAEKLGISFNTVESHRKNMLIKLGARNTAGLVRICLEHELLGPLG